MFRKVTLALAAASLGALSLASTGASAGPMIWPKHPHHQQQHHWHPGFSVGFVGGYGYNGCHVTRRVLTPYGFRWRTVNICY